MDPNHMLSPRAIEGLIAAGRIIVINEGRVLQLDSWLGAHPGGQLSVFHMIGRDATDEINAYHSSKALQMMKKYCIGRVAGPWINLTPPIRGGLFRKDLEDVEANTDIEGDTDTDLGSSLPSWSSSRTSLDLMASDEECGQSNPGNVRSIESLEKSSSVLGPLDRVPKRRYKSPRVQLSDHRPLAAESKIYALGTPDSYTSFVIQKEIADDIRNNPSLDTETQREIALKYQALHRRVKDEGFYDCHYVEYGKEMIRYSLLFAIFITCLRAEWYLISAAFLGLFWHQIMFTAHDAGHRGITHNFITDTMIGIFVADFCCGLSIGWWKSSHNVHHLVTNHPEHDPDIQNVPIFATSPSFFRSLRSSYYDFTYVWDAFANFAVRYQAYTYYPIMGIARFNLYLLSWSHLLSPRSTSLGSVAWTRPTEISFMLCYWFLFGYYLLWRCIPTWTLRIAFVLVSHVITMPLHIQITLSHWAMPTADLGDAESFPQRQLRTTMDVQCPPWLDFVHGGLQFQAVHHLFPRVPRHNLRRLQVLVREFCIEVGIEYKIFGFVDGNNKVLGRLGEVAAQVEMMIKCQQYMAETGESGLH